MTPVLLALLASARAEDAALTSTRLAHAGSEIVRVYAVPGGELLATLPLRVTALAWEGDDLAMTLQDGVALWSAREGLRVSETPRAGSDWTVGRHGLIYTTGDRVRSVDPWTGLSVTLWEGPADAAVADGFLDDRGVRRFDGTLVIPADALGSNPRCTLLDGPRAVCLDGDAARLLGAGEPVVWRAQQGRVTDVLVEGAGAGTMLTRDPGADGPRRLVLPDGTIAATWTEQSGTWWLQPEGVIHALSGRLAVYGFDGATRLQIDPPGEAGIRFPLPKPALLLRSGDDSLLLARDDGALLARVGNIPQVHTLETAPEGPVIAFHKPWADPVQLRKFNDTTWFVETEGKTTATIQRGGVQGASCGDLLALVTTAGDLEAYTLKGARRWTLSAKTLGTAEARVFDCEQGAWLLRGGGGWILVDAAKGKVVLRGLGEPSKRLLPVGVGADATGLVALPSGAFTLPAGWTAQAVLPGAGGLPEGVLATRSGAYARFDTSGPRWQVRLANAPVAVAEGRVYIGLRSVVLALDAGTGALIWATPRGSGGGNESMEVVGG